MSAGGRVLTSLSFSAGGADSGVVVTQLSVEVQELETCVLSCFYQKGED